MDLREEITLLILYGLGWAFVLCVMAMFINLFRRLGGETPYTLRPSYFLTTWVLLWAFWSLLPALFRLGGS